MNNNLNNMGMFPNTQRNQFSSPYSNFNFGSTASTNNIIWVQGIEGAKAWQLNPNSMVILLDSEAEGKMYIKVSDNIGMSTLRVFDYVENIPSTNETVNQDLDLSLYVRKDELQTLIKELLLNEQSISTVAISGANSTISNASTTEPNTDADKQPKITYVKK